VAHTPYQDEAAGKTADRPNLQPVRRFRQNKNTARFAGAFGIALALDGQQLILVQPNPEDFMQIELHCPQCTCQFRSSPNTPADEIRDRMFEDGPWYALGDGETFEDMVFAALTARGAIHCPECGEPVQVSEESLGQLTLEMLTQW
jgi:hypothetical protein